MNNSHRSVNETREEHERRILAQLESSRPVTQRSLSSDIGIALGLTNLLMRRLVKKGWVRVSQVSPGRIRYLITPAGIAAKARLTRQYFLSSVAFYRDCREHISERLSALSADLQNRSRDPNEAEQVDQIVFYGAGEIAEVAYVCLQETGLQLLGIVDENSSRRFFHHPVHRPEDLAGETLGGRRFSMLIVMPSEDESLVRVTLAMREVPTERVFWL